MALSPDGVDRAGAGLEGLGAWGRWPGAQLCPGCSPVRREAQWPKLHGRSASLRSPSPPPCDHKRPRPAAQLVPVSATEACAPSPGLVLSGTERKRVHKRLKAEGHPACTPRELLGSFALWMGRPRGSRAERHPGVAQRERGSLRAKQEGACAQNEGFQAHGRVGDAAPGASEGVGGSASESASEAPPNGLQRRRQAAETRLRRPAPRSPDL